MIAEEGPVWQKVIRQRMKIYNVTEMAKNNCKVEHMRKCVVTNQTRTRVQHCGTTMHE